MDLKIICLLLFCLLHVTQSSNCTTYPQTKVFTQNKSNYTLSNTNTWTNYPGLKITF